MPGYAAADDQGGVVEQDEDPAEKPSVGMRSGASRQGPKGADENQQGAEVW